jgi:hypothetical protein
MSELTPCNYCSLEDMKRRAKERGTHIVLSVDPETCWIKVRYADRKGALGYFLELTTECVC